MPSYQERSEINRRLADQAYFDAKLKRVEPQKKDVRIGGMDGQTGRYQVFHADGGFSNNGVRTFDGTPPSDRFVRGQQNPNSNAIALGYRDYVRTEFVNRVEEEESEGLVKVLLLRDNKLWIGGDRSEPEEIFDLDNIPEGFSLGTNPYRLKLTNTGTGLDDWIITGLLYKDIGLTRTQSLLQLTSNGFEIINIGDFTNDGLLLDGFVNYQGVGIETRQDLSVEGLPFPYSVSIGYYDSITGETNITSTVPYIEYGSPNQTADIPVTEPLTYESTSFLVEAIKTVCTALRDGEGTIVGTLEINSNLIFYDFDTLVFFAAEIGGTLPSPLSANTPYTIFSTTSGDDWAKRFRVARLETPSSPITITSAGSNFYIYQASFGTNNRIELIDINRTTNLIYEAELDPNYNPVENTSSQRISGYRLLSEDVELFYPRSILPTDLINGIFRNSSLIDNLVVSGATPSLSVEDDETEVELNIFTFEDDETITESSIDAIFIAPSDRLANPYTLIGVSFYAEP